MVQKIGLHADSTPSYCVRLEYGQRKGMSGCCKDVQAKLDDYTLEKTFFLFRLEGVDVILGVAWLATVSR